MSDGRDETEPQTNVIWLQRREQLINEYQTALSKYLIARRDARKVSPEPGGGKHAESEAWNQSGPARR